MALTFELDTPGVLSIASDSQYGTNPPLSQSVTHFLAFFDQNIINFTLVFRNHEASTITTSAMSSIKSRTRMSTTSQAGNFETEEWFHGMLPREGGFSAEEYVEAKGYKVDSKAELNINKLLVDQGHFLVRMTEPKPNQGMRLVLSVKWNKKPHHFIINHDTPQSKYYIERYQFDTMTDLIQFYINRKLPVTEKSGALLLTPVPRQDWELHHEHIELGKILGEGAFGAVHAGILTLKDGSAKKVAVKVHKGKAINKELIREICKEARTMRRYKHPNVVAFYGVAIEHEPIMLVMELISGGSLDSYLVKNANLVTILDRISFSFDAAKGLEYLHDRNCIHRDVAARNCLVNDGCVKLSDFGLSRDVSAQVKAYKLKNLKQKLPIRWLSPETLITASYTFKSDVFSFGILIWETFVYPKASEPYPGMTAAEVNAQVKAGYRMEAPENMPSGVKTIMIQHCWPQDPDERWSMANVRKGFEELVAFNISKKSRMMPSEMV